MADCSAATSCLSTGICHRRDATSAAPPAATYWTQHSVLVWPSTLAVYVTIVIFTSDAYSFSFTPLAQACRFLFLSFFSLLLIFTHNPGVCFHSRPFFFTLCCTDWIICTREEQQQQQRQQQPQKVVFNTLMNFSMMLACTGEQTEMHTLIPSACFRHTCSATLDCTSVNLASVEI